MAETLTTAEQVPKIVLPRIPIKSVLKSPKNLIIFSKPKTGKTTLISQLQDCLIIDLEDGSDFVSAMKVKAKTVSDIKNIGTEILAQGKPYKYIALDTISALENMCIPYAESIYSKTSMGRNWFTQGKLQYGSILNLPNGSGYPYLREAVMNIIEYVKTLAPHIILVAHVKEVLLNKNGAEFSSSDIAMTGKIKGIVAADSDAIGYLYNKGDQAILSFKGTDDTACGARPEHLRGKEIVLGQRSQTGDITSYWEAIYPELQKNKKPF